MTSNKEETAAGSPQDEEVSKALIKDVLHYFSTAADLHFNCNKFVFSQFLQQKSSFETMVDFIKKDNVTLVLEQKSLATVEDVVHELKHDSNTGSAADAVYDFFADIPNDIFDDSAEHDVVKEYVIFNKHTDAPLNELNPVCHQLIVNKFTPAVPFQLMLSYIRYNFVPIASLKVNADERIRALLKAKKKKLLLSSSSASAKKLSSLNSTKNDMPSKSILIKLKELEIKLLDSQDITQMRDVNLLPTNEILKWVETLDNKTLKSIVQQRNDPNINIPAYLKEQKTLSAILKNLKMWKEDIMSVVKRGHRYLENTGGSKHLITVQKETLFWKSKLFAIQKIEQQLQQPSVCASIYILMRCNYVVQARAFTNLIQISESKKDVELQLEILNSFPMKSLITSNSCDGIVQAINNIFLHFDIFKNKATYPARRIAILARACARDIADQLREVLNKGMLFVFTCVHFIVFSAQNNCEFSLRCCCNKYLVCMVKYQFFRNYTTHKNASHSCFENILVFSQILWL